MKKTIVAIIGIVVIGGGIAFLLRPETEETNTEYRMSNQGEEKSETMALETDFSREQRDPSASGPKDFGPSGRDDVAFKRAAAKDIEGAAGVYDFTVEIPRTWSVEAVPAIEALNFYDPAAEGQTNLEKSQIFVRSFRANRFLTLSTVTIHQRTETEINGRPTVVYDIEKKPGVADFPSQPRWRNERHVVTDIRLTNDNPAVFLVIAKRPDLSQEMFDRFTSTLMSVDQRQSIQEPALGFADRVTKKPFGLFVTPQRSSVEPERFSGYHTGADAEYDDMQGEVPIYAIAAGSVVRSNQADGYGGVIAIRHTINGEKYIGVYGHLDPSSLIERGTAVKAGQQIGVLAQGFTPESGGERKHVHFGLYRGSDQNIRGYVQAKEELSNWLDPLSLFRK